MTVRLLRHTRTQNGSSELVGQIFEKDVVLIGRGADCDLILDGRDVSLRHAQISWRDHTFVIEDLNSLGGVMVDGKLIKRHVIATGDLLRLANHEFTAAINGDLLELTAQIDETQPVSSEERIANQVVSLDLRRMLPSMRTLGWSAIILTALAVAVVPLLAGRKDPWSSGPLTSQHKMLEKQCAACHDGNFTKISDSKCQSCHELSQHAEDFVKAAPAHRDVINQSCVSCHAEHNGDSALISRQPKLCSTCHADLKAVHVDTKMQNVVSWSQHPEFSVSLTNAAGETARVSLEDKERLVDTTPLKLNHQIHLKKNIRGKDSPVTLQCRDCHLLASDGRTLEAVSMVKNCQSCHALEFDSRLAGVEVPHAKPDQVYQFLYAQYAQLMLADGPSVDTDGVRQKPGSQPRPVSDQRVYTRAEVQKAARSAEAELFTRTACKLCHEISELPPSPDRDIMNSSRYAVVAPQVPETWMPAAIFSHGAHEEVSCESCHSNTRNSKSTTDVLLPSIKECRLCHAEHSTLGKVTSDCVLCHSYHDSRALPESKKRTIEQIIEGAR